MIPPAESGPDGKIPPAPGTNQIAGFVEFRPLPEPIRLQDLLNSARSRTEKKIKFLILPFIS